jgi:hypothetical protein
VEGDDVHGFCTTTCLPDLIASLFQRIDHVHQHKWLIIDDQNYWSLFFFHASATLCLSNRSIRKRLLKKTVRKSDDSAPAPDPRLASNHPAHGVVSRKLAKEKSMKLFAKAVLASIGTLALTATGASAEVVCNDEGYCWHVRGKVKYKPEFKLHVHPDKWKWGDREH